MNLNAYLSGEWQVVRKLDGVQFFSGTCAFQSIEADELVLYREEGEANYKSGFSTPAFREYVFNIHSNRCGFSVYFDSACTRLFHSIKLKKSQESTLGMGTHLCGDDLYTSRYTFEKNNWIWEHSVKGPAKNYNLKAFYKRN